MHLRCAAGKRVDHYVAIVPRRDGSGFRYNIVDSMSSDPYRRLVLGYIGLIVNVNAANGLLVAKLFGRPVRRKFLTCAGGRNALRLQELPEELAAGSRCASGTCGRRRVI